MLGTAGKIAIGLLNRTSESLGQTVRRMGQRSHQGSEVIGVIASVVGELTRSVVGVWKEITFDASKYVVEALAWITKRTAVIFVGGLLDFCMSLIIHSNPINGYVNQ